MTTSAEGVYSNTLQSIIDAKLEELNKKHTAFEASKADTVELVNAEPDSARQLRLMLDGTKRCFHIRQDSDGNLISGMINRPSLFRMLSNLDMFLAQAKYDTSIPAALLENWKASVGRELDSQSNRYEFASLYARLVTDWLAAERHLGAAPPTDPDTEMLESFEEVDASAKLESRLEWEKFAFNHAKVNETVIENILVKLFGKTEPAKKPLLKALQRFRESLAAFETKLVSSDRFDESVIRWCIEGLLAGKSLVDNKKAVLKDFLNNTTILAELADVLNLRMANLDEWSWGGSILVEQHRHVTGKYSFDMNEDLLQAIFLQYIGMKWAVFLRQEFATIVDAEEAWLSTEKDVPLIDHQRREYYLGPQNKKQSLQAKRHYLWRSKYLLTQLPKTETQKIYSQDGDEEADHTQHSRKAPRRQLASKAARKSAPSTEPVLGVGGAKRRRRIMRYDSSDEEEEEEEDNNYGDFDDEPRQLMDLKHRLFHLLQTEILLNTSLHNGLTAFRARFDSWEDSLPHSTILTVMSFLGVSDRWLKFFRSFLQAPLSLAHHDNTDSPRSRERGVPKFHPLSDALGEVILFSMDLLINQECQGTKLWRTHDDFWFWSPDHVQCVHAWKSIQKFCKAFGLKIHEESAGSAHIGSANQGPVNSGLPNNPIRWGFLYLNSATGEFDIDQTMVDNHIDDLKCQLREKSTKGVFAWIQAWNVYAITFFSTNFGKPAFCSGPAHARKVLSALERMQTKVFDKSNMIQFMSEMIAQRYEVADIPAGFLFFPTELGGLELRNPFITPVQLNQSLLDSDPEKRLRDWQTAEKEAYEHQKKTFEQLVARGSLPPYGFHEDCDYKPKETDKKTFMSFDEYIKYREDYKYKLTPKDQRLSTIFDALLNEPYPDGVGLSVRVSNAISSSAVQKSVSRLRKGGALDRYWQWVFEMYGPEIIDKFGGLGIVDPGVLPIGMVSLVKTDQVEWK